MKLSIIIRSFQIGLCCCLVTSVSYAAELLGDDIEENVRGLIKPVEEAKLSSQISARITSIPFRAGDRFEKDAVLIKFDCAYYYAELRSAEAEYKSREAVYNNNEELLLLNAVSDVDVLTSKYEMEVAQAERRKKQIRVNQCQIKAPYSGRVTEVLANEHENIEADTELLNILDDSELEIEVIAPSKWLTWLKKGESFTFVIDETGARLPATVSNIGAAVDPVSQTIKLTGVFKSKPEGLLTGMSGTAIFNN